MNQWTPQNIAALCTALAAVITATGAAIHSMNTRKGVVKNNGKDNAGDTKSS